MLINESHYRKKFEALTDSELTEVIEYHARKAVFCEDSNLRSLITEISELAETVKRDRNMEKLRGIYKPIKFMGVHGDELEVKFKQNSIYIKQFPDAPTRFTLDGAEQLARNILERVEAIRYANSF